MKSRTLLSLLSFSVTVAASTQVPNGGFETWANGVPEGFAANNLPPNFLPITQSTDAHSGSYAVKGEVLANPLFPGQNAAPTLMSVGITGLGPASLTGWYKFTPANSATYLLISLNAVDQNNQMTGYGFQQIFNGASSYTQFTIPVDYSLGSGQPTVSYTISALTGDGTPSPLLGTTFHLDDLSVSGSGNAIGEHAAVHFSAGTFRPNPAITVSTLDLHMNKAGKLHGDIVDVQGRVVGSIAERTLAQGDHKIDLPIDGRWENGSYLVRLVVDGSPFARPLVIER